MSSYPPQALWACIEPPCLPMPMVEGRISAGFPSPADDFAVKRLDLNDLITHPLATFYWKTSGRSMIEAGIDDGDILVVNRALVPAHGQEPVAVIEPTQGLDKVRGFTQPERAKLRARRLAPLLRPGAHEKAMFKRLRLAKAFFKSLEAISCASLALGTTAAIPKNSCVTPV